MWRHVKVTPYSSVVGQSLTLHDATGRVIAMLSLMDPGMTGTDVRKLAEHIKAALSTPCVERDAGITNSDRIAASIGLGVFPKKVGDDDVRGWLRERAGGRSCPDAVDGSPSFPMADELHMFGADRDTAEFVARMLAQNGYRIVGPETAAKSVEQDAKFIGSDIPDDVVEAGIAAWDSAQHDMKNYVSGITTDWDEGMIVCAIYKAMSRQMLASEQDADEVERFAQWLHDEGGFDEAWTGHTWPEHPNDTGQRDGGFVKIVPSDVQAKFRDIARRWLIGRRTSAIQSRDGWLREVYDAAAHLIECLDAVSRGVPVRNLDEAWERYGNARAALQMGGENHG